MQKGKKWRKIWLRAYESIEWMNDGRVQFNRSNHRRPLHTLVFCLLVCCRVMISIVMNRHYRYPTRGQSWSCTNIDRDYPVIRSYSCEANEIKNWNTKKLRQIHWMKSFWGVRIVYSLTAFSSGRKRWVISNGHVSSLISGCCFSHFIKWVWMRLFIIICDLLYGHTTVLSYPSNLLVILFFLFFVSLYNNFCIL